MRILFFCCAVYFTMQSGKWMAALEHVAVPLMSCPSFLENFGRMRRLRMQFKAKSSLNTFAQLCWIHYLDRGKLEPSYQFCDFEYYLLLCCGEMREGAGQSFNVYRFTFTTWWATVLRYKPISAVVFIRNVGSSSFMLVPTSCKQLLPHQEASVWG